MMRTTEEARARRASGTWAAAGGLLSPLFTRQGAASAAYR
jgi:hypothetical protein